MTAVSSGRVSASSQGASAISSARSRTPSGGALPGGPAAYTGTPPASAAPFIASGAKSCQAIRSRGSLSRR